MQSSPVGKLTGAFFEPCNQASGKRFRDAAPGRKMKKTKLILIIVLVSVILLACLGFLGYFGIKTMRRSHLRAAAREAFAKENWKKAETLLNEYVGQDPASEEDFVRLAQVYRHFGNTGAEMHCWYKASTLNPLKPEYWDNYTGCAINARNFSHLFSALSRKVVFNAKLTLQDMMLYLISAVMTDRTKDAEKYYERILKANPNVFQRDDLGRFTEFLITYDKRPDVERSKYLEKGIQSDNHIVRLESILQYLVSLELSDEDTESIREQEETMLKEAVELNRFAATPILANVYFSQLKFDSVIEIAEPYLADIENPILAILYAESCVYDEQPEKLKPLAEQYRSQGRKYKTLVSYFEALYAFSQGSIDNNDGLAKHMQELGSAAQTNLANLINLQVSLNSDNEEKIVSSLETIMKNPPFYNIRERACIAVRHYLGTKIEQNPGLAEDSRIIQLAQLISGPEKTDPLLMRITISDQRNRNVLTRQILQENLDAFPFDPYLLETAAEFELFNGNPEQCLEYVDRFYALEGPKRSNTFDLLHMLALELTGKIEEATKEFTAMVDNNEMNRNILYRYFRFCIDHGRKEELSKLAERLDVSDVPDLKALAPFFRVEELLLQEKKDDALSLLETVQTDHPDFALRAAALCSAYGLLDQALSRHLALVGKHPDQRLIFANIAEVYLAKGMKAEALSYAKQAWETNQEDQIGQFVYAKMLAENGQYQEAEKVLRIPNHKVELPDEIMNLWTDIMHHAIEDSLANQRYMQAEEQCKHLLIFAPDDAFAIESREKARKRVGARSSEKRNESPQPAGSAQ